MLQAMARLNARVASLTLQAFSDNGPAQVCAALWYDVIIDAGRSLVARCTSPTLQRHSAHMCR